METRHPDISMSCALLNGSEISYFSIFFHEETIMICSSFSCTDTKQEKNPFSLDFRVKQEKALQLSKIYPSLVGSK
jgi:hypothetical protein